MTLSELQATRERSVQNQEWQQRCPTLLALIDERIAEERQKLEREDPELDRQINAWIAEGRIREDYYEIGTP